MSSVAELYVALAQGTTIEQTHAALACAKRAHYTPGLTDTEKEQYGRDLLKARIEAEAHS